MVQVALNSMRLLADNQRITASNLANQNTIGFRRDVASTMTSFYLRTDEGLEDRVYAGRGKNAVDTMPATLIPTDRTLDTAVDGPGFIVAQTANGEQVLTRRGDFVVGQDRLLRNGENILVLGDAGPITVPPYERVEVARDGTISVTLIGAEPGAPAVAVGRVRLVNPAGAELAKGLDGFLRPINGQVPPPDANVGLSSGFLESSNVNSIESMIEMIETSRAYEMTVKIITMAKDLDTETARLMRPDR
jgi:flagellar basal-body rod protein FlgF